MLPFSLDQNGAGESRERCKGAWHVGDDDERHEYREAGGFQVVVDEQGGHWGSGDDEG